MRSRLVLLLLPLPVFAAAPKQKASSSAISSKDAGAGNPPYMLPDGGFKPFVWDVPDIIDSVPVQGPLSSGGIPIKAQAVRSSRPGPELVEFFIHAFGQAGLFIPRPRAMAQLPGLPSITGLDPISGISYTAMFQANPDGTTTVILTEADLRHRQVERASADLVPPTAKKVVSSTAEGAVVTRFVTDAAPEAVVGQLRTTLSSQGFSESEDGLFSNGSETVEVSAQKTKEGGSAVLLIDRRHSAAATAPGMSEP